MAAVKAEHTPEPLPETAATRRYFVDLRLDTAIDSEKSAAGDPVLATVAHDVHPYKSKQVAIPAGAIAHGRVSRIEHRYAPNEYLAIGIVFQSIEVDGRTLPFTARPESGNATTSMVMNGATSPQQARTRLGPPNSFVFPFEKHHVMAPGTVSQWLATFPAPLK